MSHKLIFFTGAGISVDSGIPTFQEQEGIREKLTRYFCLEHYGEYIENIKSMKRIMDKSEIERYVIQLVEENNIELITKNKGQIMKVIMPSLKGKADGKLVNTIVQEILKNE